MRNRNVLIVGIVTAGVGLLVAVVVFANPLRRPPVFHVVGLEPAGVVDDSGVELALLTLSISNAEAFPNQPLFVRNAGVPLQVRIAGHWGEVRWPQSEAKLANLTLSPLKAKSATLLVPAGAEACRISFKYAGAVTTSKWCLARLAERLPSFVRFRIPWFWNWVGFEHYRPSSNWRNCTLEAPLPPGPPNGTGA